MSNTWDIMQIIDRYNKRATKTEKYSSEGETLRELYAQNLRLQCREKYGHIIAIDDFVHWIDEGFVEDYDGNGRWCDFEGNMGDYIRCDKDWLQKNRADYSFIAWYNK
jgi:hypothetical protein